MQVQNSPPANPPALVPIEAGERGVKLGTLDEMLRFGRLVVAAGLAPKGLETAEKVAIALQAGAELGFTPMQSLASIMVVNNRPTVFGDGATALVESSGLQEETEEKYEGTFPNDDFTAICRVKRKGRKGWTEAQFSIADAKRAQLWGKTGPSGQPTPWVTYPKRQLMWRARTWARRDAFSDVLRGMPDYDEQIDLNGQAVTPAPEQPRDVTAEVKPTKPKTIEDIKANWAADRKAQGMAIDTQPELSGAEITAQVKAEVKDAQAKRREKKASEPAPIAEVVNEVTGEILPVSEEPHPGAARMMWRASPKVELEVPFYVKCGPWDEWCDQPIPSVSKLAERAHSWRIASQGSKGGGRHALLLDHVQKAIKGLSEGRGITENHMRAACTLQVLLAQSKMDPEHTTEQGALPFA